MPQAPLPAVWFHGSEFVFDSFEPRRIAGATGVKSPGFWFSDDRHAAGYFGPCQASCELVLENALVVTSEERNAGVRRGPSQWAYEAANRGYDAVILPDICDGDTFSRVVCVFNPELVKVLKWDNAHLAVDPYPLPGDEPASRTAKLKM